MAIYSLEVTPYSRSRGESMPLKAAYRSGTLIYDRRLGHAADYRRRRGVELAFLAFPHGLTIDREKIWNDVEAREIRRDACVGRQIMLALPSELSATGRERCARRFADRLVAEDGVFVDCAIHEPNPSGDQRNWHVHMLFPTRAIDAEGHLTAKTRRWDDRAEGPRVVRLFRQIWADIANEELALAGHAHVRIDHRSNAERGINDAPSVKLGLAAIGFERRTGQPSAKRLLLSQPIEIIEELVEAVRSYEAELDAALQKWSRSEPAAASIGVDVGALLASLRATAAQQTARDLEAKVLAKKAVRAPGTCSPRKRQRRASAIPAARGREWSGRSVGQSLGADPPPQNVIRNLGAQLPPIAPPASTEPLSVDERTKIWAFAIAIRAAKAAASVAELAAFVERSAEFVAAELGLPAAMIKSRIKQYRSLDRTQLEGILASVVEQFRRLIDTLSDRHDVARRGMESSRRPLDTMRDAQAAVGNAILGAVEIAEGLLAGKRVSQTVTTTDVAPAKEHDNGKKSQSTSVKTPSAASSHLTRDGEPVVQDTRARQAAHAPREASPISAIRFERRRGQEADETVAFKFEALPPSANFRKDAPNFERQPTAPCADIGENLDRAPLVGRGIEEPTLSEVARDHHVEALHQTTTSSGEASKQPDDAPAKAAPQSTLADTTEKTAPTKETPDGVEKTSRADEHPTGKTKRKNPATRRGKDDWGR